MTVYDHLGNHGQVARTYQRCQQTLQAELDVSPADETEALYQELTTAANASSSLEVIEEPNKTG
jgi:DNA-binding SARP family transcriptional activator